MIRGLASTLLLVCLVVAAPCKADNDDLTTPTQPPTTLPASLGNNFPFGTSDPLGGGNGSFGMRPPPPPPQFGGGPFGGRGGRGPPFGRGPQFGRGPPPPPPPFFGQMFGQGPNPMNPFQQQQGQYYGNNTFNPSDQFQQQLQQILQGIQDLKVQLKKVQASIGFSDEDDLTKNILT